MRLIPFYVVDAHCFHPGIFARAGGLIPFVILFGMVLICTALLGRRDK